jgi:hypothetical protein
MEESAGSGVRVPCPGAGVSVPRVCEQGAYGLGLDVRAEWP